MTKCQVLDRICLRQAFRWREIKVQGILRFIGTPNAKISLIRPRLRIFPTSKHILSPQNLSVGISQARHSTRSAFESDFVSANLNFAQSRGVSPIRSWPLYLHRAVLAKLPSVHCRLRRRSAKVCRHSCPCRSTQPRCPLETS